MSTKKPDPVVVELADLHLRLTLRMQQHFKQVASGFNFPPTELEALLLMSQEPRSMSDLANRLKVDRSYVTQIADSLESEGLLRRETSPRDRRVTLLVITPQGRRLMDKVYVRAQRDIPIADGLSAEQREQLLYLLRALEAAVRS